MKSGRFSFFAYGAATALQAGVSFLSVPLILKSGGADTFSLWTLIEPLVTYGASAALLGTNFAALKLIASDKLSAKAVNRALLPRIRSQLVVAGLTAFLLILIFCKSLPLAMLVGVLVVGEATFLFFQSILRARNLAQRYVGCVFVKFSIIGAGLGFFWHQRSALIGPSEVALIFCAGSLVGSATAWFLASGHKRNSADFPAEGGAISYRSSLAYGIPLMGAVLLAGAIVSIDRYLLAALLSREQLAQYVATVKLAGAISLVASPLNLWFPAARFRRILDVDGGAKFFSAVRAIALCGFLAVAGTIYFSAENVFRHFAPGLALDQCLLALLLIGATAGAMVTTINIGLLSEGKTKLLPAALSMVAIVQALLLVALSPKLGILGAGSAICISQVFNLLLIYHLSQSAHKIDWDHRWATVVLAVFILAVLVAMVLPQGILQIVGFGIGFFGPALLITVKLMRNLHG